MFLDGMNQNEDQSQSDSWRSNKRKQLLVGAPRIEKLLYKVFTMK